MPTYNANLAALHDPSTGTAPPAAYGDAINDNFAVQGGAWTAFTPTWTGATANPAIGDGTITGGYLQEGKRLTVRYCLLMGSTTTYGTGSWRLALPNSLTVSTSHTQSIHAHAYDTSPAGFYAGGAYIGLLSGLNDRFELGFHGSATASSAVPITWASGDTLIVEGVLEVA